MNSTKNHKLFCWQSFVAYNESNEYKEGRAARGVCGGVVVVVDGGAEKGTGGECISTTLCCFYPAICDPPQWDNGECFCTLNLPLCFSFISFSGRH